MSKFAEIHQRSIKNAAEFWAEAAEGIDWETRWDRVLDDSNAPMYRWFPGGRLNTCYNAVDRHVENGRGDQAAIIYDSPVTGTQRRISYGELQNEVAVFAGVLADNGVNKGDRVIVYMPMIPRSDNRGIGVCQAGCRAFGGIRRFRTRRTGDTYQRR